MSGVMADFNADLSEMPAGPGRLLMFLGGTIGNLGSIERSRLLARFADLLDDGEHLLLGTDLVKDPGRLLAAYDDPQGVTAAFEKNVLGVINENLGANFDADDFAYVARWDASTEVVEMALRSLGTQDVAIASLGLTVHFDDGEEILTEVSAKFHPTGVFQELALAGFDIVRQWEDDAGDFAVTLARKSRGPSSVRLVEEDVSRWRRRSVRRPPRCRATATSAPRQKRSASACPQRTRPFNRCLTSARRSGTAVTSLGSSSGSR